MIKKTISLRKILLGLLFAWAVVGLLLLVLARLNDEKQFHWDIVFLGKLYITALPVMIILYGIFQEEDSNIWLAIPGGGLLFLLWVIW